MPKFKKFNKLKYKSYNNRLADNKINTLVEKRIQEIAKKEDSKQYIWYTPNTLVADANFNWDVHGAVLRVPTASCLRVNAATLWHLRLSDFGNKIHNNLSAGNPVPDMNYVRCKALLNRLEFRSTSSLPVKIKAWILAVPGSEALSSVVTMPDLATIPKGDLNGLYAFRPRVLKEGLSYKYRIIAQTVIHLQPTRLHTNAYAVSNSGSNQGYAFTNAGAIHTEVSKVVFLNHYFKGEGKRFQLDSGSVRPYREELYLCIVSDSVIDFTVVAQQRFRLEGPQQTAQPS